MSKENKLDKYFKEKFEEREFEFKDAYWQAAEELIEKDQANNNRKPFFWFILLGLIAGGGIYLSLSKNIQSNKGGNDIATNASMSIVDSEKNTTATNSIKTQDEPVVKSQNTIDSKIDVDIDTKISNQLIVDLESDLSNKQNDTKANTANQSINNNTQKNVITNSIKNNKVINETLISIAQPDQTIIATQQQSSIPKILEENSNTILDQVKVAPRAFLKSVAFIPTLKFAIEKDDDAFDKSDVPTVPRSFRKFNFGIVIGGLMHTAENQASPYFGGVGGASLEYRLHPLLSINADILYRFTKGDFTEYGNAVQTDFSFGQTTKVYSYSPNSTHYLSTPVSLQFTVRRSIIEAGIAYQHLLGVRGDIMQRESLYPWQRMTLQEEMDRSKQSKFTEGWINEEGVQQNYFSVLMGYKYRLTSHLELGLRTEYALKNILTSDELTNPMNRLNIGVNLHYYFFK